MPGIKNSKQSLPPQPLTGMYNKSGGKVRLTFKLELDQIWLGTKGNVLYMSRVMRKPDFCLCKNKGADQLCSNSATQRISAFVFASRIVQLPYFLNPKFPALSYFCNCTGWFVSGLLGNPEAQFSYIVMIVGLCIVRVGFKYHWSGCVSLRKAHEFPGVPINTLELLKS